MDYEDQTVRIDDTHVTISRYGMFGSTRTVPFDRIRSVGRRNQGALAKWRVAGAGPGSGGRNWYGWDASRKNKDVAFALDVGRFWRPTVTPTEPDAFEAALPESVDVS